MVVSPIYPDRRFNHKDPVLSPPYSAMPLKPKPFLVLHLSKNDDMKKSRPKKERLFQLVEDAPLWAHQH